jgi:hypothetical protein
MSNEAEESNVRRVVYFRQDEGVERVSERSLEESFPLPSPRLQVAKATQ